MSKLWEFFIQDDVESFQRLLAPVPKGPRSDVNARDHHGRTLLHHVASSPKPTAINFARALLEAYPTLDIYAQDWESGWTALHRALYAGNASVARALMIRDNESDFARLGNNKFVHHQSGTLIKIKDREGYSPFDVYGATITSRDIKQILSKIPRDLENDTASNAASHNEEEEDDGSGSFLRVISRSFGTDFSADEIFTFGSNKNLNLGLGDQDDRQFPERIAIQRPDHLLDRFYREYQDRMEHLEMEDLLHTSDEIPTVIANKPMKFRNVVMSKLHTAIMTDDPEANLFMCGFGPGGRLGTGDESTRFDFVCIEGGGLAGKAVVSVALGQDHSLAITDTGEIFSWGSNTFGQLGYNLPRTSNRNDVPIQTTPRQIFNAFKRERIMGAAASAIHSVVFSDSGLYTFGKNEGQLGLVDSDARSLEVQITPRRVGASLFQCPIQTVSAIDRATAVLLQNHEVWVFSQYGYSKLSFPLEASSSFIRESFMATRYDHSVNHVVKLASGGNTISALSSSGEVFTVEVNKAENPETSTSTTNPAKIRNSLASPLRAWSVKKSHMAASDVDVGQDGSIIICTTSGTAWRKEKRTKRKDGSSKDYKFARIPGLSRAVAVRSNSYGAYSVAQRDCDVTRDQVHIGRSTLWDDLLPLSPFLTPGIEEIDLVLANDVTDDPIPLPAGAMIKRALILSPDIESQFLSLQTTGTIWLTASDSEQRIPAHQFLLAGRSPVLRKALHEFRESYYSAVPDLLDIEYDKDGQTQIRFRGVDFLTVMNLVFFLYTDGILDVWHLAKTSTKNAARYRQVRNEVMRIGSQLALPTLERAARLMVEPQRSLKKDMAHAINHASFFDDADVIVQLKGGSLKVHSQVICQRCPFFEALFHGRSGGRWLESRRSSEEVHVDLKHIDRSIFDFVLRYVYSDADEHLFDQVRVKTIDDLIDLFLDVMYVANELMIDRLSQICQNMIGRFVNTRNISYLLNSVAPIYMTEFKEAALEYICLDLETMLANKYLDLDDDLLGDLDLVCHENQLACFPISRGRNSEGYVFEKYPEIVSSVETDKQRRIDAMALQTRLDHRESDDMRPRQTAGDKTPSSARKGKASTPKVLHSSAASPMLKPRQSSGDLMFQMDEEAVSSSDLSKGKAALRGMSLADNSYPNSPALGASIFESIEERSFLDAQMSSPRDTLLAESPTESRAIALHQKRSLVSPSGTSVPWGSPGIPSSKKDLKDIMGESSQSRVSNLTLGMSSPRESSSKSTQKVSQRDRKKIQQQQMQEMLAAQEKAKEVSQNPWQLPSPATPGTPTKDPLPGQKITSPPVSDQKPAQRPAMTMRQTVAGTPPPRSKPVATPVKSQSRTVSASIQTSVSRPSPSSHNSLPKESPQPPVHSIRHIPRPDPHAGSRSPSAGSFSLASILHQQQTEKDEIREAANAKHNLDEIQAEQEFQQWWDQESKRIQGLLDPEPSQPEQQQGNQQRGSGKSGRGGKGPGPGTPGSSRKRRGNKTSAPEAINSQGQKQAAPTPKKNRNGNGSTQPRDTPAGNHVPGKNPRRGGQRGRGKDRGNSA
jgi:alpha-tubulin suppressor-like RCC1 family protein